MRIHCIFIYVPGNGKKGFSKLIKSVTNYPNMNKYIALISRTNLVCPVRNFLGLIATAFGLGAISRFSYMQKGYEDLNLKLETGKGKFLVKIFSKGKKPSAVSDYVRVIEEFRKNKVPVPKLFMAQGKPAYSRKGKKGAVFACVIEFVD